MNGLLSLLIFLPVAGALLFLSRGRRRGRSGSSRRSSRAPSSLSLPLWFTGFRAGGGFLFRETLDWIPSLGVKYHSGSTGSRRS